MGKYLARGHGAWTEHNKDRPLQKTWKLMNVNDGINQRADPCG